MAAIQERKGSFRVQFNFRGKQFGFTVGRVSEAEAKFKASEIDYLLMRLKQGLVEMPPGADVVEFFRHNGSPPARPKELGQVAHQKESTLANLRDRYLETHGNGSLEAHTLKGIRRHFGHLTRSLGEGFPIRNLKLADLQVYVDKRAKAKCCVSEIARGLPKRILERL